MATGVAAGARSDSPAPVPFPRGMRENAPSSPRRAAAARAAARLLLAVCAALAGAAIFPAPAAEAANLAAGDAARGIEMRAAPAPAAAELAAWHRRYAPEAAPVKRAVEDLLAARREVDPTLYKRRYRRAAAGLSRAVAAFADRARRLDLYPEADPAARFHLRRAYAALGRAAAAGADGRFRDAELALAESARWFAQATAVLARYGLAP